MMRGFVQGADRQQTTLLPECLDDWVGESNPVRAVPNIVGTRDYPCDTGTRSNNLLVSKNQRLHVRVW
jgi:hypothetical protein